MIIRGELVNPPSSISCFRDLTLVAHEYCHYNVLIEVAPKDPYYMFLRRAGAMDYVDDILLPGEEIGLRVDTDFVYAPTVCVIDKITAVNLENIFKAIGFLGYR